MVDGGGERGREVAGGHRKRKRGKRRRRWGTGGKTARRRMRG